jgi:hypothetical protein
MKEYQSILLQSNNIIEVDQIIHALEKEGIDAVVKGRRALEIGNVELTGINGASIHVNNDQLSQAKKVLVEMGLDYEGPRSRDSIISYAYIILFVIFIVMIISMIVIAIK